MISTLLVQGSLSIAENTETWDSLTEGCHPLARREVAQVKMLSEEASRQLWREDYLRPVPVRIEAEQKPARSGRLFLRRLDQIDPASYPLLVVQDCQTTISINMFDDLGIPEPQRFSINAKWSEERFEVVRQWLLSLLLPREEQIYLARQPQRTLLTPWELFVNHWDAFYEPFATLNVVDDDTRWFFFLHPEEIAVWGCSLEYAQEQNLPDTFAVHSTLHYEVSIREALRIRCEEQRRAVEAYK